MNNMNSMIIEDFRNLPFKEAPEQEPFDSIILLPTDEIHDSDFRCMEFVICDGVRGPKYRVSGCSDALHLNGLTSSFINPEASNWQDKYPSVGKRPLIWTIDCLAESKLIRLFVMEYRLFPAEESCVSSFEVWPIYKRE